VSTTPQKRALKNYRRRLEERGIARFEILGLNADRDLIRSLAKRLSEGDADARRIRATLKRIVGSDSPKGGILAALRRSPLVGAELDLEREVTHGRSLDL
jgi:outer membrane protein TolC